ncbi:MAG: hypothetical protein ABIG71_00310 [Candidatus Uhrbacteria bacterium]
MAKRVMQSPVFWQGATLVMLVLFVTTLLFDVRIIPRNRSLSDSARKQDARAVLTANAEGGGEGADDATLSALVLPLEGVEIPVDWSDIGKQLVDTGVIDRGRFEALHAQRGGLSPEVAALLSGTLDGRMRINEANSGELLNVLWAFGLANKNAILEEGPMQDERYGGAGGFASTGGWTLAAGDAMEHYSAHEFVTLSTEQQALVERVAMGIHRPCCGNSTYFPDCNHGMAMLGLLEVLASQGATETDMYNIALSVNSYWFPSTYLTIAKYEFAQGIQWQNVDAKQILSAEYSSGSGYRNIAAQVEPVSKQGGGGGCGV